MHAIQRRQRDGVGAVGVERHGDQVTQAADGDARERAAAVHRRGQQHVGQEAEHRQGAEAEATLERWVLSAAARTGDVPPLGSRANRLREMNPAYNIELAQGIAGFESYVERTMLEFAAYAPASAPLPVVLERLKGLRVLAAEDNPVNQMVLEDNLRFEGALVTLVDNGLLAVERIAQDGASAYDVVLMDVMMPVMDGHEAASRIHAMAPSLPIIGQTAHAMVEEREQCLRSGMVDCITKPIDPDALVAVCLNDVAPDGRHGPAIRRRGRRTRRQPDPAAPTGRSRRS